MIKKLIILILFVAFTALAIGFVALPSFGMATQFKMNEKAVELADATSATVIEIPLAPAFIADADRMQVIIAFDESGIGYTEIIMDAKKEDGTFENTYSEAQVITAGFTYIKGAAVLIWLFMLLMIILLPRKHSKKKIKKIAKTEAENVVDDEMANMMPAQRYAPPPPRGPRGGEGRRRRSDYDDDYDY